MRRMTSPGMRGRRCRRDWGGRRWGPWPAQPPARRTPPSVPPASTSPPSWRSSPASPHPPASLPPVGHSLAAAPPTWTWWSWSSCWRTPASPSSCPPGTWRDPGDPGQGNLVMKLFNRILWSLIFSVGLVQDKNQPARQVNKWTRRPGYILQSKYSFESSQC